MQSPHGARRSAYPALRVLLQLAVPFVMTIVSGPRLVAQGARAASEAFTRGKPLADWIRQTEHYIPELRREAVKAIAALGPGAAGAVPILIRATRDENVEVRFWAVEAIRRVGPAARDAAPALRVVLADDVRANQEAARRALEGLGSAALPQLLPGLGAPDPWVRATSAEAIGTIGANADAVKRIARLLADDSVWVRASAAWALGRVGPKAKGAVGPLRVALAEEIRRDPTLADPVRRPLLVNLTYALGRIGKDAGSAVPLVLSVFYDGRDSARLVAGEALAGIGGKAAQPLGTAVRAGAMPVRLQAARAIRLIGPEAKKAVPDLVKVLEQTDELEGGHDLVIAAADALGAIGKPAKAALKVLERQRKKSVTPDVVAALDRAIRKIRVGG